MVASPPSLRAQRTVLTFALLMGAVTVAQSFGRFTWGFVLPGARDDLLGGSNAAAGLLGSANLAAYLVGALVVGVLATRLSLGAVMRMGLVTSMVGLGLASAAPSPTVLAAALMLMGLGGAAVWIPGPALTAALVAPERRGFAMGLLAAAIGSGSLLIGQMAAVLGDSADTALWRRIYALEFVIALVLCVAVFALLRTPDRRPRRGATGEDRAASGGGGTRGLRTIAGWVPLTLTYACFGFSYMLVAAFLIARVRDDAGFSLAQASMIFSLQGVASVIGALVLGRMSDRFGQRRTLIAAFACAAVATLVALSHSPLVVAIAAVAIASTSTPTPAVVTSYVIEHTTAATYASAFSALTFAFGVTQMVAPQIGGLLADATDSFAAVLVLSALVRALGLIAATRLPRGPRVAIEASGTAPPESAALGVRR